MTEDGVRKLAWRIVKSKGGNKSMAAKELGLSLGYLHDFLEGRRKPGKSILSALGVKKIVTYE